MAGLHHGERIRGYGRSQTQPINIGYHRPELGFSKHIIYPRTNINVIDGTGYVWAF